MSTKIYSGYILDEGLNPFQLIPRLKELFVPAIQKEIYGIYLGNLFSLYDLATYNDGEFKHIFEKKQSQKKRMSENDPLMRKIFALAADLTEREVKEDEYQYQAEILFAQDPVTERYLAYFMGSNDSERLFRYMDGVSIFEYYNNSDEPHGISSEDWQERGRMWERSVNLDEPMSASMLSLQTVSSFDLKTYRYKPMDEIMALNPEFPDKEDRIDSLVHAIMVDRFQTEHPDSTDYMELHRALSNMPDITALQYEVRQKIGADVTPEDLHELRKEAAGKL